MTSQRFSPYSEDEQETQLGRGHVRLQRTHDSAVVRNDDARLSAHVAPRHGQELGSVLHDQSKAFRPVAHHEGTNVLVMQVAPGMILHSIQAAFLLDQRHLVLSGSDGYPRVWTLWDLLNVDYTGLDLISSVKRLFPLTFVSFSFGEAANRLGRKRK